MMTQPTQKQWATSRFTIPARGTPKRVVWNFYREEDEFIDAGENLPVHREPVDSTFYEPNVIIAPPHPFIRAKGRRATASTRTISPTKCARGETS